MFKKFIENHGVRSMANVPLPTQQDASMVNTDYASIESPSSNPSSPTRSSQDDLRRSLFANGATHKIQNSMPNTPAQGMHGGLLDSRSAAPTNVDLLELKKDIDAALEVTNSRIDDTLNILDQEFNTLYSSLAEISKKQMQNEETIQQLSSELAALRHENKDRNNLHKNWVISIETAYRKMQLSIDQLNENLMIVESNNDLLGQNMMLKRSEEVDGFAQKFFLAKQERLNRAMKREDDIQKFAHSYFLNKNHDNRRSIAEFKDGNQTKTWRKFVENHFDKAKTPTIVKT